MSFSGTAFDWDAGNTLKCQKHGVSLDEIESLFVNNPLVAPDILHSAEEDRLVAIGPRVEKHRLFVIFTFRQRGEIQLIRPISARYMRDKEFLRYAQGNP